MHNSSIQPDVSLCFAEIYSQKRVKLFRATTNFGDLIKVLWIYFIIFCVKRNNAELHIAKLFRRPKSHDNYRPAEVLFRSADRAS